MTSWTHFSSQGSGIEMVSHGGAVDAVCPVLVQSNGTYYSNVGTHSGRDHPYRLGLFSLGGDKSIWDCCGD